MPQISSIVVADRATPTPVNHTFGFADKVPGKALFREAASVGIGDKVITVSWRQSADKRYARVMLTVPVLVTETVNGVAMPKVRNVDLIDCTFRFSRIGSAQERKDLIGMFANALASTQTGLMGVLVDGEGVW